MYNNTNTAYAQQEQVPMPPTVITQQISNEFTEQNKWQSELIATIESKLHSILNLRTPTSDGTKVDTPNIQDFATYMEQKLIELRANNNRLSKIIDHLNQIV